MNSDIVKKYKFWYNLTLLVGLLGFMDIIIFPAITKEMFGSGVEVISFYLLQFFRFIFGDQYAIKIFKIYFFISNTFFIWLGISAILRRKLKKLS